MKPQFKTLNPTQLTQHVNDLTRKHKPLPHDEVLDHLLNELYEIDFKEFIYPEVSKKKEKLAKTSPDSEEAKQIITEIDKLKITNQQKIVITIKHILKVARQKRWSLCKNQDLIYVYNGTYWKQIEKDVFQKFLGKASKTIGIESLTADYYKFKDHLYNQFMSEAYLPIPKGERNKVLINLLNGTFEIIDGRIQLKKFDPEDFIRYQLPFEYDKDALCPIFEKYLNKVLPDKNLQNILAEYLGYVFIKHESRLLKVEKALILNGSGANGKSVLYEIIKALFGTENISSYSLQELTQERGYFRASIADKLLNYASEINGKLDTSIFKQIVSGETITARLPYGNPMQLNQYAKLMFNCNELPKDIENTNAFFRRFMIIPFEVTIPEQEQDRQLHSKIINQELSGVFNWILNGLNRLINQKKFTHSEKTEQAVKDYKSESDSVLLFIDSNNYQPSFSADDYRSSKDLYADYKNFCLEDGYRPVSHKTFKKRLESSGYAFERKNFGNVCYITEKKEEVF